MNQIAFCSLQNKLIGMLDLGLLHYCFPLLLSRHPKQSSSLLGIVRRNSMCKGSSVLRWPLNWYTGPLHPRRTAVTLLLNSARSRFNSWPVPVLVRHKSSIFPPLRTLLSGCCRQQNLPRPKAKPADFHPPPVFKGPSYKCAKNQSSRLKYWQQFSPRSSLKRAAVIFIKLLIMDCGTKQFIKFPL